MTEIDKKPRLDGEDRISALPESLLHRILSFLDLKPVIATSLLSRRWRSLWTSVPTLDLGTWDSDTHTETPTSITLSLMLYHDTPNIREFRAQFDYPILTDYLIDSWIRFATKRHVEEFDLNLFDQEVWDEDVLETFDRYMVLPCLFDCQTLQALKLAFCDLTLHSSLSLCLLKKLELHCVQLSVLDTSGCPILESLILRQCNSLGCLNVYAPNQKLGYLKIDDIQGVTYNANSAVTLFAPNLLSIHFTGSIRQAYNIKNLSSLRSASLEFYNIEEYRLEGMDEFQITLINTLVELLEYVSHASTLKISLWCIKIPKTNEKALLQAKERSQEDLCFWEAKGLKLPPFRATCVHLETILHKSDLLWVASVLKNCQYLESLILTISNGSLLTESWRPYGGPSFDGDFDEAWELLEHTLSTNRQIKIVKVNDFLKSESRWLEEPQRSRLDTDEFLEKWEKEIKLVELLLNNCMVLEKMIISTMKMPRYCRLPPEFILVLKKRLLALPRVKYVYLRIKPYSHKCCVVFCVTCCPKVL